MIDQTEPTKSSGARGGLKTKRKQTSSSTNTAAKRACTDIRHAGTNVPRQLESISKIFETVLESFSNENSLDSGTLSDRLNGKHRFVSASIALCFYVLRTPKTLPLSFFDPELKSSWKKFTKKQRKQVDIPFVATLSLTGIFSFSQLVQMDAKVLHAERVKSHVSIDFPFETAGMSRQITQLIYSRIWKSLKKFKKYFLYFTEDNHCETSAGAYRLECVQIDSV